MVVGDGHCLWAQQGSRSALMRVDPDGPRDAVWTDGLRLGRAGLLKCGVCRHRRRSSNS